MTLVNWESLILKRSTSLSSTLGLWDAQGRNPQPLIRRKPFARGTSVSLLDASSFSSSHSPSVALFRYSISRRKHLTSKTSFDKCEASLFREVTPLLKTSSLECINHFGTTSAVIAYRRSSRFTSMKHTWSQRKPA